MLANWVITSRLEGRGLASETRGRSTLLFLLLLFAGGRVIVSCFWPKVSVIRLCRVDGNLEICAMRFVTPQSGRKALEGGNKRPLMFDPDCWVYVPNHHGTQPPEWRAGEIRRIHTVYYSSIRLRVTLGILGTDVTVFKRAGG